MPSHCRTHIFDPRPDHPLCVVAKQYWDAETSSPDPGALTLVFAHGTGFPNEVWEPCMDEIFVQLRRRRIKVHDVWAIESPNHGQGAQLNEDELYNCYSSVFRWEDYARSIHFFLSGRGTGVDVDFTSRRLVGVGHSMGGVALMLSTTYQPIVNYESFVLVEPMLFPLGPTSTKMRNFLAEGALRRRDTWASLEEAKKALLSKPQWSSWDKEVFEIYLKHGLRPVKPKDEKKGESSDKDGAVTLATPKINEGACYNDANGSPRGYRFLSTVVSRLPVHMIYGEVDNYIPRSLRDDVLSNASGGIQKLASVSMVKGAGHMVVQTHPKDLGRTIYDALVLSFGQSSAASQISNVRSHL